MKKCWKGDWAHSLSVVGIIVILTTAIFFRLWKLDSIPGVNGDEAWLGWKAFHVAHGAKLDWMTFSGNLTDPFYILPLIVLHKLFAPSVFLLRSVAVMSGILVLPVNYYFCRWIFDRKTAWGTTLLLAVLPVNIVYSRFGWEPSQSVLFALPPLYLALALGGGIVRPVLGCAFFGISLIAAVLVHPTNFLLAGFGIAGVASLLFHPEGGMRKLALYCTVTAAGFLLLGIVAILKAPEGVHDEIISRLLGLGWIHDADRFALVWGRFFNGLNSLAFITGAWKRACDMLDLNRVPWVGWPDALSLGVFGLAFVSLFIGVSRGIFRPEKYAEEVTRFRHDIILLAGFLGSSVIFDLLNGPCKCAVWFDRYALWVVPAGVLILVRGIINLQTIVPRSDFILRCGGVALCLLLLFQTWDGYFMFPLKTGGNSGMDGRVGQEDLKLSAARILAKYQAQDSVRSPVFVSSDWFVYWPTLYFLRSHPGWEKWQSVREDLFPHYADQRGWDLNSAVLDGRVVFAEFEDSWAWGIWDAVIKESGIRYQSLKFQDIAGHPVLLVKIPVPHSAPNGG